MIINADDFGLSAGVNRGIVESFREGVLSSTTLLANLDGFDDAVALAGANPDLPVGVHLSLLWGAPLSEPRRVPSLVNRDGRFPSSLTTLAGRYLLGRIAREEVRAEFRLQVRKVLDAGLRPTHLDTHKHVHCLPGVLAALIDVAGELGIDRARLPIERPSRGSGAGGPSGASWIGRARAAIIRTLCRDARAALEEASIRTTDHFTGIAFSRGLDAAVLDEVLAGLAPGTTEIMTHPGHTDDAARRYSRSGLGREREIAGLTDPRVRRRLASEEIRLVHFGEL